MPDPADLIRLAEQYKAALERQDLAALGRLVEAYQGLYARFRDKIDALSLEIADLDKPSASAVKKLARYRELLGDAAGELRKFQGFVGTELDIEAGRMIGRGLTESRNLVSAAVGGNRAVMAEFRGVPHEVVRQLLGFLQPDSTLYRHLSGLTPVTVDRVSNAILGGVAEGLNPKSIAREISRAFGMGLTDSLRMMRTVQLWTYRETSRASYVANSDIVTGWQWMARLDPAVCLSCVAMHGTVHPTSEALDDHHNGRCLMLPVVIGAENPLAQTGQAWFDQQPEATQAKMMGGGLYEAWQARSFDFAALSTEREDEVYGKMRFQATAKELL